ncbi:MAG: VOC family protein [Armatimonadota bacterium]
MAERLLRLHHAQITVPRGAEEPAREFYCGVLGLAEIPKPEALLARGGFWLRLGGQEIHVGTEEGADRTATKAHLAYEVADLEHWRRLLQERGIAPEDGVPIPGLRRFEFRDPFGNRCELIQREADSGC